MTAEDSAHGAGLDRRALGLVDQEEHGAGWDVGCSMFGRGLGQGAPEIQSSSDRPLVLSVDVTSSRDGGHSEYLSPHSQYYTSCITIAILLCTVLVYCLYILSLFCSSGINE